jgi:inosine-uridine nucleoside N-ribohydrolase
MGVTRVVIDCDPGVDDAIAILLALASPELDVRGITTVSGNVPLELTTQNALRVLELAGRADIPVAPGCDRPLVGRASYSEGCHGVDGLGDISLPMPGSTASEEHAIDLLARVADEGPFTLVAIGPLTNVALFIARYPRAARSIDRVVVMGGAASEGNTTPAAEFNIWVDPEAATRVLGEGFDLTMLPLDVTHQAFIDDVDLAVLKGRKGRCVAAVAAMLDTYRAHHLKVYGSAELPMHDALAVFDALDPAAIAKIDCSVAVDCGCGLSRGATVIDRRGFSGEACNVALGCAVDRIAFVELMIERLNSLG